MSNINFNMNKNKSYNNFLQISTISPYIIKNQSQITAAGIVSVNVSVCVTNDTENMEVNNIMTTYKESLENEFVKLSQTVDMGVWNTIHPKQLTIRALKTILYNYKNN